MNNTYKTLISALVFSSSNAVMANNDPIDISPLMAEYVATNPGLEVIVPVWVNVDHDGNGSKDGFDFHFDVYKLGTKTLLFATTVKYLPYSIVTTCNATGYDRKNVDFKRIGNNIAMMTTIRTYCTGVGTSSTNNNTGHIYAANVSVAGNVPWVKSFTGILEGFGILPDKNGNGVDELTVARKTGFNDYNHSNFNDSLYVFDGLTGTSLVTPQAYAVEQ